MSHPLPLALSFDDVLLVPQYSEILPSEADLSTALSPRLPLNLPVLSAAMDTVSEDALAIALAREGGLGVIHRNCPIDRQAEMVAKVKRSENTVIANPDTVSPDLPIAHLQSLLEKRRFSGFPVVDAEGRLVGMVTRRDLWYVDNPEGRVRDVMTPREKLITGKPGYSLEDARAILSRHRIEKLPLVDEQGRLAGLMTAADVEKRYRYLHAAKDARGHLLAGAAIGVGPDALDRAQALAAAGADALFMDAATGHTRTAVSVLRRVREALPDLDLVAGNVVTAAGANALIDAGATGVKIGVGPGSICTTRVIAGVGVPQFTAVQEVSAACRARGVACIADGGIRYSGDVIKALAAGADLVMMGSMFAGTEEAPGKLIRWQGRAFKEYRGMGSMGAMQKGAGDRYGQNSSGKLVPEGVEGRVPFKGSLSHMLFQLMGGVRSGMGYVGARTLPELREKARFVRITPGGLRESHAHDVVITEEPVNYSSNPE
jgi:IMP dehydrogenase